MRHAGRLSRRGLGLALYLFAFLSCIHLDEGIGEDALSNPDNPTLFFAGVLAAGMATCMAMLAPRALGRRLPRPPVIAVMFLQLVGVGMVFARFAMGGSAALLLAGGALVGASGTLLFLEWAGTLALLPRAQAAPTVVTACLAAVIGQIACGALVHDAAVSLALVLACTFLSAIPLDMLTRELEPRGGYAIADGDASQRVDSPVTGGTGRGFRGCWQVYAAAFVAFLIVGFSWGNALVGAFEFFPLLKPLVSQLGGCAGIVAVLASTTRDDVRGGVSWAPHLAVGLFVISWLVALTGTSLASVLAQLCTGFADGLIDAALLVTIVMPVGGDADGQVRREGARGRAVASALCVLSPLALGIVVAPFVGGTTAAMISPVCAVVYLVACLTVGRGAPVADAPNASATPMGQEGVPDDDLALLDALAERAGLSNRERDVFLLLAHGYSSGYIGSELAISPQTVKTHVKHIYSKFDVHTRNEMLAAIDVARRGQVGAR